MSYSPNIDCAVKIVREIMPCILQRRPETTLLIAGANPTPVIRELQSKNVVVTGWMNDIRDAYNSARIFIAPMSTGSGLQNKLLEAMSMELPCITSSLVAGALNATTGIYILIEDDIEKFAERAVWLLENPASAQELALAGKSFVTANFHWESATARLSSLLTQ